MCLLYVLAYVNSECAPIRTLNWNSVFFFLNHSLHGQWLQLDDVFFPYLTRGSTGFKYQESILTATCLPTSSIPNHSALSNKKSDEPWGCNFPMICLSPGHSITYMRLDCRDGKTNSAHGASFFCTRFSPESSAHVKYDCAITCVLSPKISAPQRVSE